MDVRFDSPTAEPVMMPLEWLLTLDYQVRLTPLGDGTILAVRARA